MKFLQKLELDTKILIGVAVVTVLMFCTIVVLEKSSVGRYKVGNITYLVFKSAKGIAVVNYTSDSMEYEFLNSPTKVDNEQKYSYGRDTLYLSGGDISKSLKVR